MSDRTSFLRAIRANPDDDTPRLVFADWLDEHDEPGWAEFIRVQIELDPIRDHLDHPRVGELTEREAVLLGTHAHNWLGPAADVATGYPAFGPVFRRGMPEMVCFSLDTFLTRGAELFAACPTVREVSLYGVASRGADLAAYPHLENVETLEIADWLTEEDEDAIGRADAIASVQGLRVWHSPHRVLLDHLAARRAESLPSKIERIALNREFYQHAPWDSFDDPFYHEVRLSESQHPLFSSIGQGLIAGRLGNGTAALAAVALDTVALVTFRDNGDTANWLTETCLALEWTPDSLHDRFGFTPGLIQVNEFDTFTGLSLRLWPRSYVNDYFRDPFHQPPGTSDAWWRSRGGVLRRWLHEGRFVIEWGGREFTADATGKIIAT